MNATPVTPLHWADRGACLDSDPELFFPFSWEALPARRLALARRVCQGCPVRVQCLTWAVETGEADGMWGGATPEERRRMRAARERRAG